MTILGTCVSVVSVSGGAVTSMLLVAIAIPSGSLLKLSTDSPTPSVVSPVPRSSDTIFQYGSIKRSGRVPSAENCRSPFVVLSRLSNSVGTVLNSD